MNTAKRIFAAMLVCLLLCVCMAACENDDLITVGVTAQTEGFCYISEGEFAGADIELMDMIAEKLGVQINYINIAPDSAAPSADAGTADIFIGGMQKNEVNADELLFTDPYYTDGSSLVVASDSDITSVIEVEGNIAGAVLGSEEFEHISFYYKCDVSHFNDIDELFDALNVGLIDAAVISSKDADKAPEGCTVLEGVGKSVEYRIAVSKGEKQLYDRVCDALQELVDNGTVDELLEKYSVK